MLYFHHFAHDLSFLTNLQKFSHFSLSKIRKTTISDNVEILYSQRENTEFSVISERDSRVLDMT